MTLEERRNRISNRYYHMSYVKCCNSRRIAIDEIIIEEDENDNHKVGSISGKNGRQKEAG